MEDRDYGDETDYSYYDDEDEFYFDEDNDDEDDDTFGTLIPSNPYPKSPSPGDTMKAERELILVQKGLKW